MHFGVAETFVEIDVKILCVYIQCAREKSKEKKMRQKRNTQCIFLCNRVRQAKNSELRPEYLGNEQANLHVVDECTFHQK